MPIANALLSLSLFTSSSHANTGCTVENLGVTEPTSGELSVSLSLNGITHTVLLNLFGPPDVYETEVNAGTTQPIQWLHVDVRELGGHLFLSSHLRESNSTPKPFMFGNVDPYPTATLDPPDLSDLQDIEPATAAALAYGVDYFFQTSQSSELADAIIDFVEQNGCAN